MGGKEHATWPRGGMFTTYQGEKEEEDPDSEQVTLGTVERGHFLFPCAYGWVQEHKNKSLRTPTPPLECMYTFLIACNRLD